MSYNTKKSKHFLYILFLSFILILNSPHVKPIQSTSSQLIIVSNENTQGPWQGSWDYPYFSISDAINNASGTEEIIVLNGTYREHLIIDIPITITGINTPILHGMYNTSIITIFSSNVQINNILLCYSGGNNEDAGITIKDRENITISNCTFHHTRNAIIMENCSNIEIPNNTFSNNGNGVFVKKSKDVLLKLNRFTHNAIGIVLKNSTYVSINFSSFIGNGMSGMFSSSNRVEISYCNVSENSVNKGGFFLDACMNCSIEYCLFYHNGDGISLTSSKNISIHNCEFKYQTHFAISLRSPSELIDISDCIIIDNIRVGIYIEKNNNCSITRCNIYGNYLDDIFGEIFTCNAENNYWGTKIGPFHKKNNIFTFLFFVDSNPWSLEEHKNIGLQNQLLPEGSYIYFEDDWVIIFDDIDSDGDLIPDWWEQKWGYSPYEWDNHKFLDPDGDALSNIQECYTDTYGSNPYVKDIFLEIDWMKSPDMEINKPSISLIQQIIDEFAKHDIMLHVDLGNLGCGTEIPDLCSKSSEYLELHNLYWTCFLNNSIQNPRKGIFHYGIICNYCADLNFPFIGWDAFDSFAISAGWLEDSLKFYDRGNLIAGAIMHHLGHTLGITADDHFGIDNMKTIRLFSNEWLKFLPYYSCMNYFYKYQILTYSDGSKGSNDFNDWDNMEFDFFQNSNFNL
ncbi:MAG: hypothetical protein DRN27_02500 [Thermoplasmata archaeon]|nr:MAG: hypothetical protein DRN27_02500 [Thermoplasmata archaeon]